MSRELASILRLIMPRRFEPPPQWVQANVDISNDKTAARTGKVDLSLTPYIVEPLGRWAYDSKQKVTVMAIEQTGKSSVWKFGVLWRYINFPSSILVVYPSDRDAADTNSDSFEPLMRSIPYYAQELSRYRVKRKDRYAFSAAPIYFSGGGADIISKPIPVVIGDEVDFWTQAKENIDNVRNLDKRTRTFENSIRMLVCSPKPDKSESESIIYREFMESSQGYYFLRCLGCGKLTMRSCDIHNLQWELTEDEVVEGSIRLICPECKREHCEKDAPKMQGPDQYIHARPDRLKQKTPHAGYQWGALATTAKFVPSLSWVEIARAQMKAGKSGSIADQKFFDCSFRGLPWRPRKGDDNRVHSLRRKVVDYPPPGNIAYILLAVDTQDDGYWWVMRGFDDKQNSYRLAWGKASSNDELSAAWEQDYHGRQPIMGIIDHGGHRPDDVAAFALSRDGMIMYKGSGAQSARWKASDNVRKLFLVNPNPYRIELLHYLFGKQLQEKDNHNFYICGELGEEYSAQLTDYAPNPKIRGGHEYEKWVSSGSDHLFDCEKMLRALNEIYLSFASRTQTTRPQRRKSKIAFES